MWHRQGALLVFLVVWAPRACFAVTSEHPEDAVKLLTGTSTVGGPTSNSDGNTFPQVKMPWGFNDWVPQTAGPEIGGNLQNWFFHREDKHFYGLRCTHQASPWLGDYGNFLLQPHIGETPRALPWSSERATFHPYLFKTKLNDTIGFEFAPTSHAGIIRLDFPTGEKYGHLSLSAGQGGKDFDVSKSVDSGVTTIRGFTKHFSGGEGEAVPKDWQGMFFTLQTRQSEQAFLHPEALISTEVVVGESQSAAQGDDFAAGDIAASAEDEAELEQLGSRYRQTLSFPTDKGPIVVAVATSFISQDQADLNLKQEIGEKSFDQVMAEGRATWSEQLKRVAVDAIDQTQLEVFYTNLWKAMLFPRYLQEVDDTGREVHFSPYTGVVHSGKMVTDSGFWDSYRSVYQLQSFIFADNLGSMIQGWVESYKEAGWLPQWASPGRRDSMVATMGDVVLADAIVKSKWGYLSGFSVEDAYASIRKDAFVDPKEESNETKYGRAGLSSYIRDGYLRFDIGSGGRDEGYGGDAIKNDETVSQSLNFYEADAAVARAAAILGNSKDQAALEKRSQGYKLLFNTTTKFFQPRSSNSKAAPEFDPLAWGNGFTEAGPWQYRFDVPFDVDGLSKLYDGKLCENIKSMMTFRPEDTRDFNRMSGGDECISRQDAVAVGQQSFRSHALHHRLSLVQDAADPRQLRTLTEDEVITEVKNLFDELDQNTDGCIDLEDFKEAGGIAGIKTSLKKRLTEVGANAQAHWDAEDLQAGSTKLMSGQESQESEENVVLRVLDKQAFGVGSFGARKELSEAQATMNAGFGQYTHGNQPVHNVLWIAKKAGCNAVADEYLRKVVSKLYTLQGWAGDEDNGEMGAWYILSALGLYQLEGAKDEIVLGSPALKGASLQLPNKKILKIATENQDSANVHVQAVTWTQEGKSQRTITNSLIKFTELMQGGTLTFSMGSSPKPAPNLRTTRRH